MKTLKTRTNSFIKTCVFYLAVISLIILCLSIGCFYYLERRLDNAFPTIENVIAYGKYLKADEFSRIPWDHFNYSEAIIFDETGQAIAQTGDGINQDITKDELWLIETAGSTYYYMISKDVNSHNRYVIAKCATTEKDTFLVDQCEINTSGKIVGGDLFKGKTALTMRELNIIKRHLPNVSEEAQTISKYEYVTDEGKERTLVFTTVGYDSEIYDQTLAHILTLWPAPVMVVIFVVVFMAYMFNRRIRHTLQPLNDAIVHYSSEHPHEVDKEKIPEEFMAVVDNFEDLMARLAKAREEKDKAEQERIRAITNLSHDLKTPLTVIQGYAKAFQDGMIPAEKQNEYLDTIYKKAIYSCKLIDRLFTYVKFNNPDYKLDFERLNITEYLREYLADKYSEISFNHFELDVDIPDEIIEVDIDFAQLGRAFDNLINNTLKYNEAGVTIYMRLVEQDDHVLITVADNGKGIDESIITHVFDPFVTENDARTSGKGTGLGMSITRNIINLHHGAITLVNPPHAPYSTEFQIILPVASQTQEER